MISRFGKLLLSSSAPVRKAIKDTGGTITMFLWAIRLSLTPPIRWKLMIEHMFHIGVGSLFIVGLTAIFTGMVFALQTGRAFMQFRAETLTGSVATLTISRELAPVLTGLMVTARSGSAMAAQIGTMQVTQQVDALVSMAVNPVGYLVAPRIVASVIMLPMLTAIFNVIGILGSYIVGVFLLNIDPAVFLEKIRIYIDVRDFVQGIFKSIFFGLLMASICCYRGYQAHKGAEDVGKKVTEAVVVSSIAILVADYFLTALLF